MKTIAALIFTLMLSGCAFNDAFVRKEVVIQKEYVIRKATDQQKALPPFPAPLNVETADQLALAQWIVENEKRQLDLVSIIKRLIEYYERTPTVEEKKAIEPAVK